MSSLLEKNVLIVLVVALAAIVGCGGNTEQDPATPAGGSGGATTSAQGGGGANAGGGGGTTTGSSCANILASNPSASDGIYTVDPGSGISLNVYCDMSTDSGGWTLAFLSSATATNKDALSKLYEGDGLGSLTDNAAMYAVAQWGPAFFYQGIELRVSWKCGTNLGVADLTATGFGGLDSGVGTWKDDRTAVVGQSPTFHQEFSNYLHSGTNCHGGMIRDDYIYGFAIGNGNGWGQFVGWFGWWQPTAIDWSTAISDQALDNVDGTVAGWFR
jgi:hypothetical protein